MNEFSKRLREARKARSFTQEELAEKADISRVMISRYETGSVIPTVDVLISLADALDVSIDYLLGRDGRFSTSYVACNTPADQHTEKNADIDTAFPKSPTELRQFILRILKEYNLLD